MGLGLMGGSFAKAIRSARPESILYACDKNPSVLEDAVLDGTINAAFSPSQVNDMLSLCDLVFICLYPAAVSSFILEHEKNFKSGSVITDIAGVKVKLAEELRSFSRTDVSIILGHPMAGSEREGYTHASAGIFKGRNYIFIPVYSSKENETKTLQDLTMLKNLAADIGFTRIIETTPEIHDHKIAFTSQLCHVIASALVESAEDTEITAFGGGSFEDLTRIAMINAPLWTELFIENKEELLQHIEVFEKSLEHFKKHITQGNSSELKQSLEGVRTRRIAMARLK